MKIEKIIAIILAMCGVVFWPSSAQAELVTIQITGEVDFVGDPYGYFEGKIKTGDTISGRYTYDSDMPDSAPEPWVGKYEYSQALYGMILEVGGFRFETNPRDVDFIIYVSNDRLSPSGDIYSIVSNSNLPLSDGVNVEQMYWQLDERSGQALSSDALPTIAPVLADWQLNSLGIHGPVRGNSFGIVAHVTSTVLIPEPATILLFGLGLFLLSKRT